MEYEFKGNQISKEISKDTSKDRIKVFEAYANGILRKEETPKSQEEK